jgi:hypothetical protein
MERAIISSVCGSSLYGVRGAGAASVAAAKKRRSTMYFILQMSFVEVTDQKVMV